jgi:hypothetical protein
LVIINLSKIKIPNLSELEGWTRGGPELWLKVWDKNKNEFARHYFHMRRNQINDKWWSTYRWIGYWNYSHNGESMYFSWYEEDGGSQTQSVNVTFEVLGIPIGFTFKIGSKDDQGGGQTINKDYYNAPYNTGIVEWRVF